LVSRLYDELRVVARAQLRGERRDHTLGTTGLVHETYLRLVRQRDLDPSDRPRFFSAASATMRRVLLDYARRRNRGKRGGDAAIESLEEAEAFLSETEAEEILVIDDALRRLAERDARAAQVLEYRFFAGLSLEETAELLGVSSKTVQRDWLAARAWLRKEVALDLGIRVTDD
jgi:RNA polymerase sigma-70 factor (ECF subfamily)